MSKTLNWGILGTGAIAKTFATGVKDSDTGTLAAVGSRHQETADKFADEFDIPNRHGSYEALLADAGVDAVYVSTPHPLHAEWAIKAAEAGKHVLCEKPLGLNAAEAMAMVEQAEVNRVVLMEAFMYRCHPQTAKLVELVRGGAVGEVRLIDATFSFQTNVNPNGRLFKNDLGGGGIMDVGCYPVSFARLIAGAAAGEPFLDPTSVSGAAHLGETGIDEWAAATLKFANGIVAQVATGVRLNQQNTATIYGSEGRIVVPNPWIPAKEGGSVSFTVHKNGKEPETVEVSSGKHLYGLEADAFAAAVANGEAVPPAMTPADSMGNMRTLDSWRQAVGLAYDLETPKGLPKTNVANRPVQKSADAPMQYGEIPHVGQPVSRFIIGADNQNTLPHTRVMLDDWFARGGNAIDTAFIYGGGRQERLVGQWINSRGLREQIVLIVKGIHTPYNNPQSVGIELDISLGRLGTDYADLYIMHRDNPDYPVGEFVEAVNKQIKAGKVKAYGGSNWSPARVDEAVQYAKDHGLQPMSVINNNFSLARMVNPVWGGCVSASDPASRAWLTKTQTPILSWSSQARGFFVPERNASPENTSDKELVNAWYSDDNFERQQRCFELAAEKGVDPITIAAAYVLNQPFPTFALIGPRQLSETRTSLPALGLTLTEVERKWLNLEQDSP